MKKTFTLLSLLFSMFVISAQENIIRNGGFEDGLPESNNIKDLDDWYMDKETPGSGWWGDENNRFVTLTSGDSATLYQVVETVPADSILYELDFTAYDSWNTDKVVVTASVSEADTSVRMIYKSDSLLIGDDNYSVSFGFSTGSDHAGKKLIIEFTSTPLDTADDSWTQFDNVYMVKRIPGVNNPPVADAGAYQSAIGTSLVTLDGSGSSDPDSDPLTYIWISTFPGITLSDPAVVNPTFTAPDVMEITTYTFALIVGDGEWFSDTALTNVTVIPKGELIRNGDFQTRVDGADPASTDLKDIANWNVDEVTENLGGGIWGPMVTLASADPTFYQVVGVIGEAGSKYSLSFSARSSWNAVNVKSIFSVTESDSTIREKIDSTLSDLGIDPANGINTSDYETFKHILNLPANSEYVGKRLVVEFDIVPYDDGNDDGWCEIQFASLVYEELPTNINPRVSGGISIYPNPVRDVLYFNGEVIVKQVRIYSMTGRLEKSITQNNLQQVDITDLAPGLYMVNLITDKGVVTRKIEIR